MTTTTFLLLLGIGLLAGLLSGLIGIGGGVIMVPLLLILGLSQHQAQGTSLTVLAVPVTALAAFTYYKEGHVDWRYAAVMAVFFVIGGYFGSKFAIHIEEKVLKKIFGVVLLLMAGKLIFGK
ncbi:sulfite exporter TauE/SafE family protein [Flavobacterium sp.]|uniref:sulfite exporter TauE/SafE family protein n=1 Tax=Flavobacterium sp. TaxID=239 RepID=UPI00261005C4|nr:sulfite exporter TauE/SafE family protein [Flavobacterium sp.]MDD2986643.1 sulfite exporter TauE/SafE family protein [Flavobacterium sp.]